ncbi:glycosyltransferase family 2 protein [Chitinophaga sp. G-6-1-13]|uniref:Glycosyltransferase family 2 protein n=1 Tax=Chitinophaga fulva TaxID=2728842 RepID=A0A848GDH9_9BACT|nr:glycosyltransferase family 2 protein [Chitinophaga fulva]NML35827.1 glycosyltransferase family 2 protein [Chitinophaga fulva]
MNFLVSIITPAYNVEDFIKETIESVINQTYKNWELIIVDDCSKDETFSVAQQMAETDARIKPVKAPLNGGAAAARNLGTTLANGEYIAFLDSDDLWHQEKLEIQLKEMVNKNAVFSYSAYHVVSESGEYLRDVKVPDFVDYKTLLKGCDIGCLTAMYDVQKLGKQYFLQPDSANNNTGLPENILRRWGREDYVLWLSIAKQCEVLNRKMIGIRQELAYYRKRDGGISANKRKSSKFQWIVYRNVERLNFFYASYNFILYAINGVRKHYF